MNLWLPGGRREGPGQESQISRRPARLRAGVSAHFHGKPATCAGSFLRDRGGRWPPRPLGRVYPAGTEYSPAPAPAWGPEGVCQILDRCKQGGWTRVYWRCFDAGRALYSSKLLDPLHSFDADDNYHRDHGSQWVLDKLAQYDWAEFDAFAEALSYGHSIGLKVHAWLSINEDDHGYGLASRFTREHPHTRWVRREGTTYRSQQSFAFPEVRAYKLALLREILAYQPDGVFLDWIRTGDVRDNPHTDAQGMANYGYEAPNVRRFRARYGLDPHDVPRGDDRWVAVRAEPQTAFMREARAIIKGADPATVVSVLVHNPWAYRASPTDTPYDGNLRGLLLDVSTWAEEGLMDEAVAAGCYREGGNAQLAYRALQAETAGRCDLWLFGWIASPEQFLRDVGLAERLGAVELLLWESDYVGLPPANEPLVGAMRGYASR